MPPYHILSLDGGGIRGVLTAALLERLEQGQPGFLDEVDLIAGTSTGGILSLGLASGLSPSEARQLYEGLGEKVFKDSFWDNLRDLGQARGAQYSNKYIKEELTRSFGSMTLNDLQKRILISSFDLDNEATGFGKVRSWKPKYFHNFPGEDSDGHERVVDVALYTSAAPTYFPVYKGFIDGGVISNNPAMCALAQALQPDTGMHRLSDIRLLSVGTGYNPKFVIAQDDDWGLVQWAPHVISLMMEGSMGLADYQCRQLLHRRYLRINPVLPMPIGLDGVDQVPVMKSLAMQFDLEEARKWLKRNFKPST
ncbi:MAG: patatin-like phospholipase family protein [Anaerolineales bacterium]